MAKKISLGQLLSRYSFHNLYHVDVFENSANKHVEFSNIFDLKNSFYLTLKIFLNYVHK